MSRKITTTGADGGLRLLRAPEVAHRTGLSVPSLYRLMAEGRFPQTIPLSHQAVAWPEHEIDSWIRARIAERDGAERVA